MKLTVVIVSYNVKYYLEQCLYSVQRAIADLEAQVVVVDNHSADGTIDYLTPRFPNVTFIDSNHNLGFARANNLAIRQTQSDYVLLLNPDTFVGEDTLTQAVRFMDSHPDAGGVGVMMHNPDGTPAPESRRALPTPYVSLLKMLGMSSRYYMSHLPWHQPAPIDIISGAFCLLRRSALERVGLLDEDFFMYGEDIDLSYRLLKAGYQNWYLPLPILHYKGESTQKTSFRYVHTFYQAMLIFFRKHYGHLSILITLPIKVAIYLRALIALTAMAYWYLRRLLGFLPHNRQQTLYCFDGSPQMQQECRKLARRKGLPLAPDGSVPGGISAGMPPAPPPPICLVMDTTHYPFKHIIDRISHTAPNRILLGTYSHRSRVIITPNEVIQ